MTSGRKRQSPVWLQSRWELKKRETKDRVVIAVQTLAAQGRRVTIAAVCDAIKSLSGRPISANTIKRNPFAYEIYLKHRVAPRIRQVREVALVQLYQQTGPEERVRLGAQISRLRRESKDSLIARIVTLQRSVGQHTTVEHNLRDEIIRLRLNALQTTGSKKESQ